MCFIKNNYNHKQLFSWTGDEIKWWIMHKDTFIGTLDL